MTPDAADGNTQQGQAAPVPQGMSRPRRSPVKRVRRGEETQGSGRGISACGSSERSGLCVDEEQGVSRILTINLNDVEKELHIK